MTMAHLIGKYSMIPLYVLCIALFYPVSGENGRVIQNVTAKGEYGEEAVLTCILNAENATVKWEVNNVTLEAENVTFKPTISNLTETTNATETVDDKNRTDTSSNTARELKLHAKYTTEVKGKRFILKIANATESDALNYTCVTEGESGTVSLNLSFPGRFVKMEPRPEDGRAIKFNLSRVPEEDKSLNLTCVFEVYNQSVIEWVLQRAGKEELLLTGNTTRDKKQLIGNYNTIMEKDMFDVQDGIYVYVCLVWDPHSSRNLTDSRVVKIIAAPSVTIDFAKPINSSEIYLNWTVKNYNSNITGYELQYKISSKDDYLFSKRINITTKFFVLEELSSNTSYDLKFKVKTFAWSPFAVLANVTTLAKDPVFVPNISINGFTARSMTISMGVPPPEVADYVDYYLIEVWKKHEQAKTNTTDHIRDEMNLPHMFGELEPHTTYVFRAKACFCFKCGGILYLERFERCGNWSKEMEAITMDGVPNEPDNVEIACSESIAQGYYMNLTWKAPSKPHAEIKGYMMEITGNSNYIDRFGKWKTDTFGPLSKFLTNETFFSRVPDLKPNMNYTVRLMAMTRSRRRGQEEVKQCKTGPGPPDNPPRPRWRKVEEKQDASKSRYSLRVLVPRITERNGPICCYRVYLARLPAGKGWLTTAPQDLPVITYEEAHPGPAHPDQSPQVGAYITDIFNHENYPDREIILGDNISLNMPSASEDNSTCARCFEAPQRKEAPTTARVALATTEADLEFVTDAARTRRSLDTKEHRIIPVDGELYPKSNYTLFVELIPGTNDPSLYSGYTMALNSDIPDGIAAANTMEKALQICCAVAACLLLGTLVVCVVHTRRARKQAPRHAHVELNPIQAALRYVVGHIGGRTPLAPGPPPDLPPIAIEDLAAAYAERQADSDYGFQKEFELLQMLPECYPDRTTHASEARENQPKNRYPDIKAYDQTRVKLAQQDGVPGSDYINANYVMGYKEHKQFICAQGPTDTTVNDFWRMIWEGGLELIVMLTNLEEYSKVKCSKYWPDEDRGSRAFGHITVHHVGETRYSDYIVRELKIVKQSTNSEGQPIVENNGIAKRNGDCKDVESGSTPTSPREAKEENTRVVRQYHFLMWKDFAAPEHPQSILKFIKRMNEAWSHLMGRPVVVHCSAGVGRTGTLVALDCLLEQLRSTRRAAVFSTVADLRRQRNFLVQSLKQYVFVYRALVEYAHYGDTEIPASRLKASIDRLRNTPEGADKCLMEHEFEKMMNPPVSEPLKSCSAGSAEEARARNRSPDCLPYDRNRVILAPAPPLHYSTYINASFIEAYDNSEGYIITQDPLPNTIMDFWRMVSEHNVSTIVMLSELGDGKCPRYWDDGTAQYDHISVQYEESESCPYYTRRQFRVTNNKSGDVTVVRQLQYHGWPTAPGHVPEVTRGLASLADAARADARDPTMVLHCQYGTERAALFAALCILIAQLRAERRADAAAVARKVRSQRAQTINTFLQYEFLHRAILNYAELHNLLEDS